MRSFVFLIQGKTYEARSYVSHSDTRRENTVLRGQLYERDDSDPSKLTVRKNVSVIPNALVADQFKPHPPKLSGTSKMC